MMMEKKDDPILLTREEHNKYQTYYSKMLNSVSPGEASHYSKLINSLLTIGRARAKTKNPQYVK